MGGITMKGNVHSIESMGLTDGRGIRFIVFFQGCSLRCAYCHNPDTWSMDGGKEMSSQEVVGKALRFKPYFESSGGGVTCSGGDPLLQPEFLIEFLRLCKQNGLHTTLDTAGFGRGNYEEILKYTDLVMLDVKHVTEDGYKKLTGKRPNEFLKFVDVLRKTDTPTWIRHVVVPGVTDGEDHIERLNAFIGEMNNIEKVELLPYHVLGVNKYKEMGIPYRLKGVAPMDKKILRRLQRR